MTPGKIYLKSLLLFVFVFSFNKSINAQSCQKLKSGRFYFYPANTADSYMILRNGSIQQEIDLGTKDTSFWKISWKDNCIYEVQLLRSTKKIPEDKYNFMKSHTVAVEIGKVTDKFYTFFGSVDVNGKKMGQTQDTIWLKPREEHRFSN